MFELFRCIKETYEFVLTFKGKDIHVFVSQTRDEEKGYKGISEIYYVDEQNEKKAFEQEEERIFKDYLAFQGFQGFDTT